MKKLKFISYILCFAMVLSILVSCASPKPKDNDTNDIPNATSIASAICIQSPHYKITGNMFSYFFYKDLYDAIETYYDSYLSASGFDRTKDLKEQEYGEGTWFDYFVTVTTQNISNYILYAESAYDNNVSLDDDDYEYVDSALDAIVIASEEAEMTEEEYIHYCFGDTVSKSDVREALEFERLANKQYLNLNSEIDVSDDEISDYYNKNKNSFLYVDFRQVQVRAEFEKNAKDSNEANAIAKQKAEYIASSKDISEYVERSIEYLKSVNDPTINNQIIEAETDEQIRAQMTNVTIRYGYTQDTAFGKWAFQSDRKDGDMTVLDNGSGIYTAYYLDSAPYRCENLTVNIANTYFAIASYESEEKALEAAQTALDAFNATNKKSEDFEKVSLEYSLSSSGKVQKNVDEGELSPDIQMWAFDSDRVSGDCVIIQDENGYNLCYFEGNGMISWQSKAYNALFSSKVSAMYDELVAKYGEDGKFNIDNMNLLSGVTPYTVNEQ